MKVEHMENKILVTLGPSSLEQSCVERLTQEGVHLFRINLSHTRVDRVEEVVRNLQCWTDVPVCLDSEGAQIRNQDMVDERVGFELDSEVTIHPHRVVGDSHNLSFTPDSVYGQLREGDRIRVDFNSVALQVERVGPDGVKARVVSGGHVGSNKAADLDRQLELPAVTPKDREAFTIGLELGVKNFSLSFTNSARDVAQVREIIGEDSNLISKIESIDGVRNLEEILPVVDQILIDRGDLSREVPIEKIPFLQRRIIAFSRSRCVPVFVATNLLESMVITRQPTRAEVNDVVSTLMMGANGLVLAAETAIGVYPLESVQMVNALIHQCRCWSPESSFSDILESR